MEVLLVVVFVALLLFIFWLKYQLFVVKKELEELKSKEHKFNRNVKLFELIKNNVSTDTELARKAYDNLRAVGAWD